MRLTFCFDRFILAYFDSILMFMMSVIQSPSRIFDHGLSPAYSHHISFDTHMNNVESSILSGIQGIQ